MFTIYFQKIAIHLLTLWFLVFGLTYVEAGDLSRVDNGNSQAGMGMTVGVVKNEIVLIGASYAKAWNIEKISGLGLINKGVGGNETKDVLSRFQADVVDNKPKAVIIWGFINDVFRSQEDQMQVKLEVTKENIMAMVESARRHGITAILATEVTITSRQGWKEDIMSYIGKMLGKRSYAEYINKYVMQTNEWLRGYAAHQNIQILEFEKVLADSGGERKKYYAVEDGSHLSPAAYEALTSYIQSVDLHIRP